MPSDNKPREGEGRRVEDETKWGVKKAIWVELPGWVGKLGHQLFTALCDQNLSIFPTPTPWAFTTYWIHFISKVFSSQQQQKNFQRELLSSHDLIFASSPERGRISRYAAFWPSDVHHAFCLPGSSRERNCERGTFSEQITQWKQFSPSPRFSLSLLVCSAGGSHNDLGFWRKGFLSLLVVGSRGALWWMSRR